MAEPESKGRRPAPSAGEPVTLHLPLGAKGLSDRWLPIGAPEVIGARPERKQKQESDGGNDGLRSSRSRRR